MNRRIKKSITRELAGRVLGGAVEAFIGRAELWARDGVRLRGLLSVEQAIDVINRRWPRPTADDAERPIFVFSAGWRSGSTLLQRLLISQRGVLIWGEPYTMADYVGRMSESLRLFGETSPPPEFFLQFHAGGDVTRIQEKWIAHLYPEPTDLYAAHRAFLMTLLAEPARQQGFPRWGLKDCKYGIDQALYLRWLFPKAKFFFVYRNPYHAWRSFRLFGGYSRWPEKPVFTARQFGDLWAGLMEGFLRRSADLDAMAVKYEDLIAGAIPVSSIAAFANLELDASVMTRNVSGRGDRTLVDIPYLERRQLAHAVEPIASQLGYVP